MYECFTKCDFVRISNWSNDPPKKRLASVWVRIPGHVYCLLSKHHPASMLQNPGAGVVRETPPPDGGAAEHPHDAGKERCCPSPGEAGSLAGGAGQPGTMSPLLSRTCFLTQQGGPVCLEEAAAAAEQRQWWVVRRVGGDAGTAQPGGLEGS